MKQTDVGQQLTSVVCLLLHLLRRSNSPTLLAEKAGNTLFFAPLWTGELGLARVLHTLD